MKKYMVRCDMEGVTGVVSYEQAEPGRREYEFGRAMFMSDLLALLEGLRNGGAEEVVIYDEHYDGRNIDLAALPEFARAICGKPPYREDWPGGLDDSFAGVILLGFHSKADTPGGLLPHSYELDIRELRLNGISVGEIGMEAAIAGDCAVSVLMVAGDSAGVAEAEALLPGVLGVSVKESLGAGGALCYPAQVTADRIRSAAERIARRGAAVAPYRVGPGVVLEIEFNPGPYLDSFRAAFADRMSGPGAIRFTGERVVPLWAEYWQMKLLAQRVMKGAS